MIICYYSYYLTHRVCCSSGHAQPDPRAGRWSVIVDHDKKTLKIYINTIEPENKYKKDFKACGFYIFQQSNTSVINLIEALKREKYKVIKTIDDPHPWEREQQEKESRENGKIKK